MSDCICGYDARNNERDSDFNCPVHFPKKEAHTRGDVVERMKRAYGIPKDDDDEEACTDWDRTKAMTAVYNVARADVIAEACDAIYKQAYEDKKDGVGFAGFVDRVRARLAQADKPRTLQERVDNLLAKYPEILATERHALAAKIVAELEAKQ